MLVCVCVCDFHCRLIDLYCCPGKRADARYCDVRDKSNASRFIDDRSGCGVSSYRSLGGRAVLSTINGRTTTSLKCEQRLNLTTVKPDPQQLLAVSIHRRWKRPQLLLAVVMTLRGFPADSQPSTAPVDDAGPSRATISGNRDRAARSWN